MRGQSHAVAKVCTSNIQVSQSDNPNGGRGGRRAIIYIVIAVIVIAVVYWAATQFWGPGAPVDTPEPAATGTAAASNSAYQRELGRSASAAISPTPFQ